MAGEVTAGRLSERFPGIAAPRSPVFERLLDTGEVLEPEAGEALVAQGTPSADLFLVLDGSLDVVVDTPFGSRRVASVAPGAYFGEVSLLDPGPAGASVVTEQGCTLLRLSRERFDQLGESDPATAAALLGEVLGSLGNRARAAAGGTDG